MRLYVPATLDELDAVTTGPDAATWTLAPRTAHAVTAPLRDELAGEDDEGLEYAAALEAADDSLALVAARPDAPPQRLVITVDVPDDSVGPVADTDADEVAASAMRVSRMLPDVAIVCVHVDELAAADDVRAVVAAADAAAADGSDDALDAAIDRMTERDLLWYDWSELGNIPRA